MPGEAVQDLAKLELLEEPGQLEMHVYRRRKDERDVRFKVYRYGEPMMLSTVLPVLHSLGVRVADERPYEIARADGTIYIYDFGLVLPDGARDLVDVRPHVENAFSAAWRGEAEVDGFNELVVRAGLTWRQVRDPAGVREVPAPGRHRLLAGVHGGDVHRLPGHRRAAGGAVRDPVLAGARARRRGPRAAVEGAGRRDRAPARRRRQPRPGPDPAVVPDADPGDPADVVLPARPPTAGQVRTSSSSSTRRRFPDLPAPRPQYEIFVYSPRFEGVHLRFGPVARGGLRWSDRRDDFRTEVLGLVKAQMVKNAVIVPVGAKGGFVLKQAAGTDGRDAFQAEGVACYKLFISALLDITDNLVGGKVVPPADVVRHDGDDPYLVVAADKGTATFSDIANEISIAYGFWLGDAFASGGSAGYDHKKMGITARGAWESVKRHFRDMDLDTQSQDFTVVGVGDMSGDVFGNGMLLSEHIRLVAAFDHRHIFIDPTPTAASSFVERERLFDLPRSSWADYDTSLISAGGGVFPRTPKSIPLSAPARAALGIADRRHVDDAQRADEGDPAGAGRPAVERRHRHLRQGRRGVARRRRRQGQRRDPGQRQAAAVQGRRRGRQPRPDPARPDRVRADRAAASAPTSSTTRPASTAPTTRSTSRSCSAPWSPTAS